MTDFLFNLLILLLFPLKLVLAIWSGILSFIKTVIKEIKDWSDLLTL